MDFEWVIKVIELAIPLLISATIWVAIKVSSMSREIDRLIEMHEHPESTGFGTVGLKEELRELNHALRALIHYVKWTAKEQTGKTPPPSIYYQNGDNDL